MPSSDASRAPAPVYDSDGEPLDYDEDGFDDAALDDDPDAPPRLSKPRGKGKQKTTQPQDPAPDDTPRRYTWKSGPLLRYVCMHFPAYWKQSTKDYARKIALEAWTMFAWDERYNFAAVEKVCDMPDVVTFDAHTLADHLEQASQHELRCPQERVPRG